jgi:hypothetical protein
MVHRPKENLCSGVGVKDMRISLVVEGGAGEPTPAEIIAKNIRAVQLEASHRRANGVKDPGRRPDLSAQGLVRAGLSD